MEEARGKKTSDARKEKHGFTYKKKNFQEKKTKSDTSANSVSSITAGQSLEDIIIVGKSCTFTKSKSHESYYRPHECPSKTLMLQPLHSDKEQSIIPIEGIQQTSLVPTQSDTSFTSAKSDISTCNNFQPKSHNQESKLYYKINTMDLFKSHLDESAGFKNASTETALTFGNVEDIALQLKEMEKQTLSKEKKIKDLNKKIDECCKTREKQKKENQGLSHEVNLLNRQLHSMYELLAKKNWNDSIDPAEFIRYKNKALELEDLIVRQQSDKTVLKKKLDALSSDLESKEKELNDKNREIIEYKNKSTLEICKLMNQIEGLERKAKVQSQLLNVKISQAESSMDDEIVNITKKLEEQYQKDLTTAVDKLHSHFDQLANLPKTAVEKLLQFFEPNKLDFISALKDWDRQESFLKSKILSMQADHSKEMLHLKDSYESKIIFLKTQVESLASQLKERKEIIDIFESELMTYKSNSSMNLLRASSKADDITSLKELYTTEIFSQKQVHKLEMDIFEEKVKTLSEEILYYAKNEEIHFNELENAKKMAFTFREKYEQLVLEWEERVDKDFKLISNQAIEKNELESVCEEFKSLIRSLNKSQEVHEEKIRKLQTSHDDQMSSCKRDMEIFKNKLEQLEVFQKAQTKLDDKIQQLIKSIGINYTKTVEALETKHIAELSLKQLEICSSEKRYADEISSLKKNQEKEIIELHNRLQHLEEEKMMVERELEALRKTCGCSDVDEMKTQAEKMSLELLKKDGMIAIKEEAEQALNHRIKQLEDLIKEKEENCRKELEELVAKLVKVNVLSSAKDELIKELEDKLNDSEKLLGKTVQEVDQVYGLCSRLEKGTKKMEGVHPNDGGDFETDSKTDPTTTSMKLEKVKVHVFEVFEKLELLEKEQLNSLLQKENSLRTEDKATEESRQNKKLEEDLTTMREKNFILEEEIIKTVEQNKKLVIENDVLSKAVTEKEKIIKDFELKLSNLSNVQEKLKGLLEEKTEIETKMRLLETEKSQIIFREESLSAERDEILAQNRVLEQSVNCLNEKVNLLMRVLQEKGEEGNEIYSISLQEVRVLYQEEQETISEMENKAPMDSIGCQVGFPSFKSLPILEKNEFPPLSIVDGAELDNSKCFYEDIIMKFKNIENELSEVMNERNELLTLVESLEKKIECQKEEIVSLQEENNAIRASYEAKLKLCAEKGSCSFYEESSSTECKVSEMTKEIGKLSSYIKTLSTKLDAMKASNENLLSESSEHLRQNQNLISELEEAWSQRYEIEDQLTKVRRENALLNLHRNQLEETNKRISNLIAEGKPSAVSWIKIHETVESIVNEVLALKTSFSDSGSTSGTENGVPKTESELKLMQETLHAQLQNKTVLCDELLVQKATLERELKALEDLLKQNDSRLLGQRLDGEVPERGLGARKRHWDALRQHSSSCLLAKKPTTEFSAVPQGSEISDETHLLTLNKLKKRLENQVEREEAQFRESLEFEIEGLKKMQISKENGEENNNPLVTTDDEKDLELLEIKYEEEVEELSREFESEVEKLRTVFAQDKDEGNCEPLTEELQAKYAEKIEKLRFYFEKKWADLENRYQKIYSSQRRKKLNSSLDKEREMLLDRFRNLFDNEEESGECQKSKMESFLKEVLNRYIEELKLVQQKYQEGMSELEKNHMHEVQKLKLVIDQLQDNLEKVKVMTEKKNEENEEKNLVEKIRIEYEEKLENERRKLNDLLEEARQKYEKEILNLEEFWTEKLSECETTCALMKATVVGMGNEKKEKETEERLENNHHHHLNMAAATNTEQNISETSNCLITDVVSKSGQRSIEKPKKDNQDFVRRDIGQNRSVALDAEKKSEESFCLSCLSNQTYFDRMEVKTDDDKLEIVRERDELKEMVSSLRVIVAKLLNLVGQYGKELNNSSLKDFDIDDTLYKSIHIDLDQTRGNVSTASNSVHLALDLSTIIQEINDNSLLNSSDQVRFELERCLKQLKKDAAGLLALSCPDQDQDHLRELIKKVEREKNELEAKVRKVEELQDEMQKEIVMTKDKLAQWERNLEVISEGYGEELVKPKKLISLSELKDKLKLPGDHYIQPSQDLNLLEEICKEGDRLQDEWKRERLDLQQQERSCDKKTVDQIDVADKQLHSLRKFLEEQAAEREQERETFDKEINKLKEDLKAKERDNLLKNRTNKEVEVLEEQLKELSSRLSETEKNKEVIEGEFQNAVKKIWSLREVIQDLEVQLAEVSERELNLKKEVGKYDTLLDDQTRLNRELKEELKASRSQGEIKYSEHIKNLEEEVLNLRHIAEQISPETLTQMKANLREIETMLMRKTKDLEQLHTSSANVSCSSPSEDVSLRDQLDATRCSTPDEMFANNQQQNVILPLEEVDRIQEKLIRHNRAEEVATKYIRDLKMQLRNYRKSFEEVQTERDILLERVDSYLKENSSLKVRLEEQRCNAGLLQKQLNADLESQINRLEVDVEKLNELCIQKDKQLGDMKVILENTTKSLKMRETEVLNKSKEENTLISTLKMDLANALDEKQKVEESLERMKEKLREQVKMPTLIDSMLEEKNAEIDRLEKEVTRLSNEKSVSFGKSFNNEFNSSKGPKRIKFSEPDSFGECISSISAQNPSTIRNFTDSFGDMRNSSFKVRQPLLCSPKLESMSSIGPLQLSPRGTESCRDWKTSSPIMIVDGDSKIQPKSLFPKNDRDFQQLIEDASLQSKIESKQREVSELKLEVDVLKRKLVEVNEKLEAAKSHAKEIQNDLFSKDEEIRKLKNNEKSLLMTVESLKKNHEEELEELQNKVSFERGKVEKVYEEIKALEVKKIEIEEAFFSLKEDYTEKVNSEQKKTKALFEEIKDLEVKKTESDEQLAIAKKELGKMAKELKETNQKLSKDISDLKEENERLQFKYEELSKSCAKILTDAEIQVEIEEEIPGRSSLNFCELEMPKFLATVDSNPFGDTLKELKEEVEKMGEVMNNKVYNKKEIFTYVTKIRSLLSCVLNNANDVLEELETHRKRLMECSVDDLACKVQRELVLSAKLDNKLLSSIGVNGFGSKDFKKSLESVDGPFKELGGGDSILIETPKKIEGNENLLLETTERIALLEREKLELEEKITDQEKIIESLEKDLSKERCRVFEEKERCTEDARIMELLRVNLEKGLQELKSKDRDLKRERQQRINLEKELELYRKNREKDSESKRLSDLISQLESYKSKMTIVNRVLEDEKKKNQELRLSLEQNRIERVSEKGAQKLLESDLSLLRERNEKLKTELINASKMLNTRNAEIGLLKRRINLQEIDIKALSHGSDFRIRSESDVSSVTNQTDVLTDSTLICLRGGGGITYSLLDKMKKLNTCIQRHVHESNEMGEALLYLSQETEQMKGFLEKLEEGVETKGENDAIIEDLEVEKKLWDLEKGRLVMDVENLRGDYEVLKRDSLDTYKNNEVLKLENSRLKAEIKSLQKEIGGNENYGDALQDRVAHLMGKYMRAESYRKALSWQKQYLLVTLNAYLASEEEAWKKLGKLSGRRKEIKGRGKEVCKKFRVVALTVLAIFRMRYIVRRWQKNRITSACLFLGTRVESKIHKQNPLASILNIYNEPINPLSYQTQNIFREPTSRVLRTPPSRDPGSKNYYLDADTVSKCLETVSCLQENIGTAKVAP